MITFPEIHPTVSVIIFSIWLIFFFWSRAQFDKVKEATTSLVLANIGEAKKLNKSLNIDQYFEILYPKFEEIVKANAKFIPHKTELFPMPAKPLYVKTRMNFTPEWIGAILKLHGNSIIANKQQQETINYIIELSKIKSRNNK